MAKAGKQKPLLVNGEWVQGSGAGLTLVNPATGETSCRVSTADEADVNAAVEGAAVAAEATGWRALLPHKRAEILSRIADRIDGRSEDFTKAQMLENGKTISESRTQAKAASATFRYFGAVCETQGSEVTPPRGAYLSMTCYEPYGVVAAITPWNSPMTMEAQKVAPALAAGNAVVLKPSEVTPSCALLLGEAALEAGLPPGCLNILPGTGAETGSALIGHPLVRMVSFTGGTESGRRIAAVAAERLIPAALELGGKSPHIVFADADLEAAVQEVASGIFEGSGQSCVAGSRLFVQRSRYDEVVSRVVARAKSIKVDLPDAPGAEIGPIASFAHRDRIEAMVDGARSEGGEILAGGRRSQAPHLAQGAFYDPTVVTGLANDASICQQEVFGPVLCVMPFDDEEDLIEMANGTVYGLAAGIWTADYRRAWRVARKLDAGTVWINTYKKLSIATPFGGFKQSGIGRGKGHRRAAAVSTKQGALLGYGKPARIIETGVAENEGRA